MPYNHERAQTLLRTVPSFARLPGAEFIAELGEQLKGAAEAIAAAETGRTQSDIAVTSASRQLEDTTKAFRDLKDKYQSTLELLKEIAAGAHQHPQKVAADFLKPPAPIKPAKKTKKNDSQKSKAKNS